MINVISELMCSITFRLNGSFSFVHPLTFQVNKV